MIRFGTGGWRAEIGKDFQIENLQRIGQALADRIRERGEQDEPVIIGYDRRFLSDSAAGWLAEVLCANGLDVLFLRRSAPTPLIMHTVRRLHLHYGLEVTASHNPPAYNGVKLIVEEGRDAPVEVTRELEERLDRLRPDQIQVLGIEAALGQGKITYLENPFNDFLDDILAVLDIPAIRSQGLRILFDSMHGSAAYPFNVIFHTVRCTVDQINGNKDAYFGGKMPAPTEHTLRPLAQQVAAGNYDLGIGVDGDGDRLGVIDAGGDYISANDILVLLYYYLHEYKGWKGPVVRNMATTHLLDRVAAGLGERCYEVPVGFKYISAKLDETDAVLGGESSGGLTVRGHIHGKDSVYAAALFVEMICKTGKTPGQMMREIRSRYGDSQFEEQNLPLSSSQVERLAEIMTLKNRLPVFGRPYSRVNYEDGCKVYFPDDSFVICRPSGTEPLLRIFAEAATKEQAKAYIRAWEEFLL